MQNLEFHNDLKQMSQDIYKKDKSPNLNGWTKMSDKRNDKTGFHGEIYQKGKELVIVFEGTSIKTYDEAKPDLYNDFDLAGAIIPAQVKDARAYYDEIKNNEKFKDCHITLTGHSLAGSIGQIISYQTGEDAVTFNAYGAKGTIPTDRNPGNIINYGNANDPIFTRNIDHQLGKTYVLDDYTDSEGTIYKAGRGNSKSSFSKHMIENMGDLSKAKEYTNSPTTLLKGRISYDEELHKENAPTLLKGTSHMMNIVRIES